MTTAARTRHVRTILPCHIPGKEHLTMFDTTSPMPAWVEAIGESREPRTAATTAALAQLLASDDDAPSALRAIARAYLDAPLYRAKRPRARKSDPDTSKAAAEKVRATVRRPGGKVHRILAAYRRNADLGGHGWTAREFEGVDDVAGAWKRVSELEADGLLRVVEVDGAPLVRTGGRVLTITDDGRRELARMDLLRPLRE